MNSEDHTIGLPQNKSAGAIKTLNVAATFWFITAVIGQWLFVYYIIIVYGGSAIEGNLEAWGKTTLKGHVAGDTPGNFFFASHVLMAAIITFGGTLQLIPQLRNRARKFHRWNGRLFIFTAFVMAFGGFYLVWVRDSTTTFVGSIGVTLNGFLIIIFAGMALYTARARNFVAHRKWALRAFLMVNGVWFFRIGFMAWIIINQGPRWSTDKLDGPFDMVWAFANYLLPLIVLELYLFAQDRAGARGKFLMSTTLFLLTLVTALGIFAAFMFMWKPYL